MTRKLTIAVATAALAATAAAPAVADAAPKRASALKGTVVGAPYVASSTTTAIPVLISKQTAKRARLKSPIGVLVVPRRRAVRTTEGNVMPSALRLGDRWKGSAQISSEARRAVYSRISLKKVTVYKRSKTLSTDELETLIRETRRDLGKLSSFVTNLSTYTQNGFRDLNDRFNALRGDVDGLLRDVSALRADLTALSARLDGAIAGLQGISTQVAGELQPQVTQLITTLSTVSDLVGVASCPSTPGSVLARVCTIETVTVPQVDTVTGRVDQISSALTTTVNRLTNLSLTGDLPATLSTEVNTALGTVYGLIGQVGTLTPQVSSLTDAQTTANTAIANLEGLVGGLSVTDLDGRLSTLLSSLGANTTTGAISGLTPALLSSVQSQADQLQGILAGTDAVLGNGDDLNALIATANTNIAGLTTGQNLLTSQVGTICTNWRTALSGVSAPVLNLLGVLSGNAQLPALPGCPTS